MSIKSVTEKRPMISLRIYQFIVVACLAIGNVMAGTPPLPSSTYAPIVNMSPFDTFLAFPPEYVALLGLGICFLLLSLIVIIIICMTGRARKQWKKVVPQLWSSRLSLCIRTLRQKKNYFVYSMCANTNYFVYSMRARYCKELCGCNLSNFFSFYFLEVVCPLTLFTKRI